MSTLLIAITLLKHVTAYSRLLYASPQYNYGKKLGFYVYEVLV